MKALHEAGEQLLSEFYGLSEEELCWRATPEDLSLKETVAHLRDAQELALAQLHAIFERKRRLPHWDIDLLPAERDYQSEEAYDLLRSCEHLRTEVSYFFWGLDSGDWDLEGEHPFRGRITVGQIAKELADHDLGHLWQVRQLKARLENAGLSQSRPDPDGRAGRRSRRSDR